MKISAVVLTFNSEKKIATALKSLSFVDEIVVVDSGSTDNTVPIAKEFGAKVFFHPWNGYKEQKKFGIQQTSHDWVFVLDSDEEVSEGLILWIMEFKKHPPNIQGVSVKRTMVFDGEIINVIWRNEYRIRLFNKSFVELVGQEPHEKITVRGSTLKVGNEIYHYSYDGFKDQVQKLVKHAVCFSESVDKRDVKLLVIKMLVSPLARFLKTYVLNFGFLIGLKGFVLCMNEAFYSFLKYALALERHVLSNRKSNIRG
ncbi:MAG: glycosyltransferase family 2 protein [Deltaproteobacteria bacterium]|nr:glycosyltransferase family 2 protein [Deltaproteobacteria bacterium]